MAKVDFNTVIAELPLSDERGPEPKPTLNRHVNVALNHLQKRRTALLAKRAGLTAEIDKLDQAILALE